MKIPKQLFVVSKAVNETAYDYDAHGNYIGTHVVEVHRFGFLHPHESTKANAKRKQTQLEWAYDGEAYQTPEGQWWHKGSNYTYDYVARTRSEIPYDKPIDSEYAPCIWDNEPRTGFKIVDTICRYRGNKLFKVMDPRGVEFEITAACLFNILMNCTVQNGEIIAKCVWAGNKNLVIYT